MRISRSLFVPVVLVWCVSASTSSVADEIDFNRDIRPILSDNCIHCHGPDDHDREADLRLDTGEGAHEKRDDYFVVVPGKPEQSELFQRITTADDDLKMPPVDSQKKLDAKQIELIKRWIEQGGQWAKHWAYEHPRSRPRPKTPVPWGRNWVDTFLWQHFQQYDLRPAESADPTTLIRRLYFDLTGLPPSRAQVQEFVSEPTPQKYAQIVDSLLASEHFGEKMAIYWLDLVRYADTVGYHGDQDHNISPYRDYVIDAFNRNLPFDQFTREQLAGDLLPNSTIDQKIATGYNRLLQTSHEGGVQAKEYLAIYGADRVRNLSAVWLGGTLGCAQCHDHKYDPYTIRDFYAMQAFFADIDEAQHFKKGSNSLPTARPPEIAVLGKQDRDRISALEENLKIVKDKNQTAIIRQQIAELRKRERKTMITVAIAPREIRVLPRGDWLDDSGPIVQPAIPEFLGKLAVEGRATRLDLANWLVDSESGAGKLTARVLMNRIWYLLFGRGLASVMDDFGGQGRAPMHPELLDELALELIKRQWDVKAMIRLIVSSSAYQQSSIVDPATRAQDPLNDHFARQGSYPLPAEAIRDNALAVSNLLNREIGGPSVKPYQPAGYYRHLNFPTRRYAHDKDDRQWRRGVYVHWQRQFLHPMLKAFDAPSREECTVERSRSTTPLGALTLLNDPTFVESSRVFAARILTAGGDTTASRAKFAFAEATSREPDAAELAIVESLYVQNKAAFTKDVDAARRSLLVGQAAPADDSDLIEHASWTVVARMLLNLSEVTTRN